MVSMVKKKYLRVDSLNRLKLTASRNQSRQVSNVYKCIYSRMYRYTIFGGLQL